MGSRGIMLLFGYVVGYLVLLAMWTSGVESK